jgi:tetratricopeptide (TPR) repeat protein
VELLPDEDEQEVFRRLQRPGSKILDLRQAAITSALFRRLADAWHAAPGMVPRLAIVLDYERWVVFRRVAMARLTTLHEHDVEVEIVYGQLADLGRLSTWFARGRLQHATPAIIAWLRIHWRPTAIWPWVLDVTAHLVEATADAEEVPDLLLEISDIALLRGETDGLTEAAKHARSALSWIGDAPSVTRCRALRALAATATARGDTNAATTHLNMAEAIAAVIEDASEETHALIDLGSHALRRRDLAVAETLFGRALVLAPTDAPSLRAMIHNLLARALAGQAKHEQASRHAELALALQWDPCHRLAGADRTLIQRIQDQSATAEGASR